MTRLLADEDLDNHLVRGVLRHTPGADIVRVQDVGLSGASDAEVLAWSAEQQRAVVTHDAATLVAAAYARTVANGPMQGVFVAPKYGARATLIEHLALIASAGETDEWAGRVVYLPLR
ncbi:MAG: DUF5615 family PIN-like protein [Armatimonadetes bacterium]|nr:DUF5615 family PIN-like protein [Armatimonadota bacterium]